ncbi:Uncharacterised protein [Mycobacterium tuberculosis]|uniref:Uncharacterized protein n=1 Tax=Mycobacterium tuberculosis TaxID=1773 RepID=A0A0T7PN01_MYCTX|nr:Uncharacterised protein [Mycobacterium tuberculosis]CFA35171.1 Uncharacterised protein [Mycobacterium tuberculosis]CFA81554.1 Uncharacterised protein [Mycobacterium tuberculosis]CFC72169.1 Uncharacterised protein [Mycobacterium tuberculosis]CFJ84032.1 Uncharacterised protein [Mycobacterium tuberculosis]
MFALPRFQNPRLAKPTLKVVSVGPFCNHPARLVPMLSKPETFAGAPKPVL